MATEEFSAGGKDAKSATVTLKVAILGDAAVGKTSMMVKYIENRFDEDYIQTLGTLLIFVKRPVIWNNLNIYSKKFH